MDINEIDYRGAMLTERWFICVLACRLWKHARRKSSQRLMWIDVSTTCSEGIFVRNGRSVHPRFVISNLGTQLLYGGALLVSKNRMTIMNDVWK